MRAAILALLAFAAGAQAETFTRAEVAKMSPRELAARVLGGVAQLGAAKELKFYVSPVAPTPPWLEQVQIDLPPSYLSIYAICMTNRLVVDFAPLDPDAKQHMFDSRYDPPTQITNVETTHRYAEAPNCPAVPETAYFTASSEGDALQALDGFRLFRKDTSRATCVDFTGKWTCPKDLSGITGFSGVISIQEERRKDASTIRTIVLSIPATDSRDSRELWLTLEFRKGVRLAHAELRNIWGPPIP
ncbi:MAG TPA: hypothetical protein VGF56_10025 [Rhizomicrobium sp.]|jgi:hypothetical protein